MPNTATKLKHFSSKKLKFKQGKLVKEANDSGLESDMVYNWAKTGVCMGTTANWLKNRSSFTDLTPLDLIQKGIEGHYLYKKAFNAEDKEFLEFRGLKVLELDGPVVANLDMDRLVRHWQKWDTRKTRQACLTFAIMHNGTARGHAIGLRDGGKGLEVFDPNFGWYEVNTGPDQDSFFQELAAIYSALGWVHRIEIMPVA